jgi:hypothetical protein
MARMTCVAFGPPLRRIGLLIVLLSVTPFVDAKAQFHTVSPKSLPEIEETRTSGNESSPNFFAAIAGSVVTDRAYIAATAFDGWAGNIEIQLSYAQVVAADTGTTAVPRVQIHDRVATVMRLVQNGGAATVLASYSVPSFSHSWSVGAIDTRLFVHGGFLGKSSDDTSGTDRGAGGVSFETVGIRNLSQTQGRADFFGQVWLGARGGYSHVFGGRIVSDVAQRGIWYVQGMAGLSQKGAVLIGFLYTWVPKPFQPYIRPGQAAGSGSAR